MFGMFEFIRIITVMINSIGMMSFDENIGLNFIFSRAVWEFAGFEDPFSCNSIRCIITIITITIGKMKCSEKNRFRVGWFTDGPPQIHVTRSYPTIGMADSTPVITVAPQNDICPHGNTYPKNAVAIVISIIIIPDIHTFILFEGDLKYIPRAVCIYITIKNKEAPFMCSIRMTHPIFLSRIIITIVLNTVSVWAVYIMDKIRPVIICVTRIIPNMNPMFHNNEIDVGVGRSMRDFFISIVTGFFLISWFFI
jgi:hypothetical protein